MDKYSIQIGATRLPFDPTHLSAYTKANNRDVRGLRGVGQNVPTGRYQTFIDFRFVLTGQKLTIQDPLASGGFRESTDIIEMSRLVAQFRAARFLPIYYDFLYAIADPLRFDIKGPFRNSQERILSLNKNLDATKNDLSAVQRRIEKVGSGLKKSIIKRLTGIGKLGIERTIKGKSIRHTTGQSLKNVLDITDIFSRKKVSQAVDNFINNTKNLDIPARVDALRLDLVGGLTISPRQEEGSNEFILVNQNREELLQKAQTAALSIITSAFDEGEGIESRSISQARPYNPDSDVGVPLVEFNIKSNSPIRKIKEELFSLAHTEASIRLTEESIEKNIAQKETKEVKDDEKYRGRYFNETPMQVTFDSIELLTHPGIKGGCVVNISCLYFNYEPYISEIKYYKNTTSDSGGDTTYDLAECNFFKKLYEKYILAEGVNVSSELSIDTTAQNLGLSIRKDRYRSENKVQFIEDISTVRGTKFYTNFYEFKEERDGVAPPKSLDRQELEKKGGIFKSRVFRCLRTPDVLSFNNDELITDIKLSLTNAYSTLPLQGGTHPTCQFYTRPKGSISFSLSINTFDKDQLGFLEQIKTLYAVLNKQHKAEDVKKVRLKPIWIDNPLANSFGMYYFNFEDLSVNNADEAKGLVNVVMTLNEQIVPPIESDGQLNNGLVRIERESLLHASKLETVMKFLADKTYSTFNSKTSDTLAQLQIEGKHILTQKILTPRVMTEFLVNYSLPEVLLKTAAPNQFKLPGDAESIVNQLLRGHKSIHKDVVNFFADMQYVDSSEPISPSQGYSTDKEASFREYLKKCGVVTKNSEKTTSIPKARTLNFVDLDLGDTPFSANLSVGKSETNAMLAALVTLDLSGYVKHFYSSALSGITAGGGVIGKGVNLYDDQFLKDIAVASYSQLNLKRIQNSFNALTNTEEGVLLSINKDPYPLDLYSTTGFTYFLDYLTKSVIDAANDISFGVFSNPVKIVDADNKYYYSSGHVLTDVLPIDTNRLEQTGTTAYKEALHDRYTLLANTGALKVLRRDYLRSLEIDEGQRSLLADQIDKYITDPVVVRNLHRLRAQSNLPSDFTAISITLMSLIAGKVSQLYLKGALETATSGLRDRITNPFLKFIKTKDVDTSSKASKSLIAKFIGLTTKTSVALTGGAFRLSAFISKGLLPTAILNSGVSLTTGAAKLILPSKASAVVGTGLRGASKVAKPLVILTTALRNLDLDDIAQSTALEVETRVHRFYTDRLYTAILHNYCPSSGVISALNDTLVSTNSIDSNPTKELSKLFTRIRDLGYNLGSPIDTKPVIFNPYYDLNLPTYREVIHFTSQDFYKLSSKISNAIRQLQSIPKLSKVSGIALKVLKGNIRGIVDIFNTVGANLAVLSENINSDLSSISTILPQLQDKASPYIIAVSGTLLDAKLKPKEALRLNKIVSQATNVLDEFKNLTPTLSDFIIPIYSEAGVEPKYSSDPSRDTRLDKIRTLDHYVDPTFYIVRQNVKASFNLHKSTTSAKATFEDDIEPIRLDSESESPIRADVPTQVFGETSDPASKGTEVDSDNTRFVEAKLVDAGELKYSDRSAAIQSPDSAGPTESNADAEKVERIQVIKDSMATRLTGAEDFDYVQDNNLQRAFPCFIVYFIREFRSLYKEVHLLSDLYKYDNIIDFNIVRSKHDGSLATLTLSNLYGQFDNDEYDTTRDASEYELTRGHDESSRFNLSKVALREGTIIQIKQGYSANEVELENVFVGKISEVSVGDVVTIIAQGLEHELMNHTRLNMSSGVFTGHNYFNFFANMMAYTSNFGKKFSSVDRDLALLDKRLHSAEFYSPIDGFARNIVTGFNQSNINHSRVTENIWIGNNISTWDWFLKNGFNIYDKTLLEAIQELARFIPGETVAFPTPYDTRATMFLGPATHHYKYTSSRDADLLKYIEDTRSNTINAVLRTAKSEAALSPSPKLSSITSVLDSFNSSVFPVYSRREQPLLAPVLVLPPSTSEFSNEFAGAFKHFKNNTYVGLLLKELYGDTYNSVYDEFNSTTKGYGKLLLLSLRGRPETAGGLILAVSALPSTPSQSPWVFNPKLYDINSSDTRAFLNEKFTHIYNKTPLPYKLFILSLFWRLFLQSPNNKEFIEALDKKSFPGQGGSRVYLSSSYSLAQRLEMGDIDFISDSLHETFKFTNSKKSTLKEFATGLRLFYTSMCFVINKGLSLEDISRARQSNEPDNAEKSRQHRIPGFRPFRQYHEIKTSEIVRNEITCTVAEMANQVHLKVGGSYNGGTVDLIKSAVSPLFAPENAYENHVATFDVFQPLSQRLIKVIKESNASTLTDQINIGFRDLAESMKPMYGGQIVIIGKKEIKPFDVVTITDTYNRLKGSFEVARVVHSHSLSDGWTTTITPHLLAYASGVENTALQSGVEAGTNIGKLTLEILVAAGIVASLFKGGRAIASLGLLAAARGSLSAIGSGARTLLGVAISRSAFDSIQSTTRSTVGQNFFYNPKFTIVSKGLLTERDTRDILAPLNPSDIRHRSVLQPVQILPLAKDGKAWTAGLKGASTGAGQVNIGSLDLFLKLSIKQWDDVQRGVPSIVESVRLGLTSSYENYLRQYKNYFD